jgi:hypothetical protein
VAAVVARESRAGVGGRRARVGRSARVEGRAVGDGERPRAGERVFATPVRDAKDERSGRDDRRLERAAVTDEQGRFSFRWNFARGLRLFVRGVGSVVVTDPPANELVLRARR